MQPTYGRLLPEASCRRPPQTLNPKTHACMATHGRGRNLHPPVRLAWQRSADRERSSAQLAVLAAQVEHYFADKVKLYEQMRGLESELNDFMQQKLLSIREDLLASGGQQAKVKSTLKICVQVDHGAPSEPKEAAHVED